MKLKEWKFRKQENIIYCTYYEKYDIIKLKIIFTKL